MIASATIAVIGLVVEILGLAASIAVPYAKEHLEAVKTAKNGIDTESLVKFVNSALQGLQLKSTALYNEAIRKLNNLPEMTGGSDIYRKVMERQRKTLSDKAAKYEQIANNVQTDLGSLQNRASAISYLPDSVKTTKTGEAKVAALFKDASNVASKYEQQLTDSN